MGSVMQILTVAWNPGNDGAHAGEEAQCCILIEVPSIFSNHLDGVFCSM